MGCDPLPELQRKLRIEPNHIPSGKPRVCYGKWYVKVYRLYICLQTMVVFPVRKLWPAGNNPTVRLTLLSQVASYLESINIQQRHLLLGATFPMPPLRWLLLFPSKKKGGFSIRKIISQRVGKGRSLLFQRKTRGFSCRISKQSIEACLDDAPVLRLTIYNVFHATWRQRWPANVGVVNFQMELHGQAIHESYEWFTNPFSLLNIFIITGVLISIEYIIFLYIHE